MSAALTLAVLLQASPAQASSFSEGAAMAFDVFPVRFLTGVQVAVGAGLLVPCALLAYPAVAIFDGHDAGREVVEDAYGVFVRTPYEYTFTRPLGGE